MARVPYVSREDLPADKRGIYDHIAETRGKPANVFLALLNGPDAAEAVAGLGEFVRFKSTVAPDIRETAILSVARERGNQYEWAQHEPLARQAGVRDEVIESIRSGRAPMGLPAKEGVFAQAAKEFVRQGKITERTFQAIEHLIGIEQTISFAVLVGYYDMLGRLIETLEVDLDEGLEPGLPESS